jgi:hypothetical protein
MSTAIHRKLTVLPGGKIELVETDLPEGLPVDVFVVVPLNDQIVVKPSVIDTLDRAPGHRLFHTVEDVDAHIHSERDSWDK